MAAPSLSGVDKGNPWFLVLVLNPGCDYDVKNIDWRYRVCDGNF